MVPWSKGLDVFAHVKQPFNPRIFREGKLDGYQHPEGAYTDIPRDVFGKPTAITRHNSGSSTAVTRSYSYNANQELCRTVEPETGATLNGYDGAGNVKWSAAGLPGTQPCEPDGTSSAVAARKASRTYDARNRLWTLSFPDGQGNQSWTYTADGLPFTVSTSNPNVTNPVTTTYGYNHRRQLTSESLAVAGTTLNTGYGYDANGHVNSQTYPSTLAVAYAPNALGQPTQAGSFATSVSYYPNGGIQQFTYGNGIVHTMTQNARQLPGRSTDVGALDLTYGYDANGNVSQIIDNISGRQTRGMSYDNLDRLKQATSIMWGTANYDYDVLDNITRAQVGASSNYGARDQYYCYVNNQLTSIKTGSCSGTTVTSLSYDLQGNLSNKNGQGYTFDYGNRLRNVPGKEWYAYDGQGRRVLSCNAGACDYQQYTLAGQPVYGVDNRNGKIAERIYLQGSLVAIRETPTGGGAISVKYQHIDALGSPVATTDGSKATIERTEYEPYGAQTNRALTDGPNFTGHVLDASTGLVYMQQRYYDPIAGRFLSVDPVATDANTGKGFGLYTYSGNNPYSKVDPDGRDVVGIEFKNYMVDTGFGFKAPLGHAGVLLIDNKTGATKYYEYGRYDPNKKGIVGAKLPQNEGNVRRVGVPDVKIGKDGQPTEDSLKNVYKALSEGPGHGATVQPDYNRGADEKEAEKHILGIANNPHREKYKLLTNSCKDFCEHTVHPPKEPEEIPQIDGVPMWRK